MSNYLFMLENHLSTDQNRVVAEVQAAASAANFSLFLAGGALRDMLGGFQIRDLDFIVEGNAPKLAKTLTEKAGAKVVSLDDRRRTVELLFPAGVTAGIGMSRKERYPKAGAQPQVTPAPIQEDLRRRDFTVNAIALSLNRASRGLLLDPMNGLADLGRKELRTLYPTALYDDPARLLRMIRLRLRLGYAVEEKTQAQYANAREAKLETHIPPRVLCEELKHMASEPNPAELVRVLEQEGLLALISPALTGSKLNLAGLAKLEKAQRLSPPDVATVSWGPFLHALTEPLSGKERQALIDHTEMNKAEVDAWQKLPARAKKLETALKSARLEETFANLRCAGQSAFGRDPVPSLPVAAAPRSGSHQELPAKVYCVGARDHRCGGRGQGCKARHSQISKAQSGDGRCAPGRPNEKARPAASSAGADDGRPQRRPLDEPTKRRRTHVSYGEKIVHPKQK